MISARKFATLYFTLGSLISPFGAQGATLLDSGAPIARSAFADGQAVSGTQSPVDGACVAPFPFFGRADCSYNQSNPWNLPINFWLGPVATGGYYRVGESPFAMGTVGDPPVAGDGKYAVTFLTGSLITIDDNDTACDGDDVISGTIILGAATRAFFGGPGTRGEETWGDGDIVFPIPATTVNVATPNGAGGCDYEIASAGFPPLLESTKGGTYIFDAEIVPNPPSLPDEDSWVAPAPVGVGCGTTGNCGVSVDVTVGPGWSCIENAPGPCEEGPHGGFHFRGTRSTLENFLISISTNGNGDITTGTIFANNELDFAVSIPPNPNSWDGPLLNFTGALSPPFDLDIKIKPKNDRPNDINLSSGGVISVAILTNPDFDALQVDASSLAFGPGGAAIAHQQTHVVDIDKDGDTDLVAHFRIQETGIACGNTEATLTGETFAGDAVSGSDAINTVGKNCD